MPHSSPPDSSSTHADDGRTPDLGAPRSARAQRAPKVDAGAKRRALKKAQSRRRNLLAAGVVVVVSCLTLGATEKIWAEYRGAKTRIAAKQAELSDLQEQLERGQKRLSALASAAGKERVLVENAFIKPGERLLLFPKPNQTAR